MSQVASWSGASYDLGNNAALKEIQEKLGKAIEVLQKIEALAETVLDLIKAVAVAYLDPIKAVLVIFLAAVRLLIKQFLAMGIYFLPVIPDFNQPFPGWLTSISGGFSSFEAKIVNKLRDRKDPSYPPMFGSNFGFAAIFAIGASSPQDLVKAVAGLASLLNNGFWSQWWKSLPTPIDLKARPALVPSSSSLDIVFPSINLNSSLDANAIVLEWQIEAPTTPRNTPDILASARAAIPYVLTPNFIVERSQFPSGQPLPIEIDTQTRGEATTSDANSSIAPVKTFTNLLDVDRNSEFRFFESRVVSDEISQRVLGSFQYVDRDVKPGVPYYYRVRPYLFSDGWLTSYLTSTPPQKLTEFPESLVDKGNGVAFLNTTESSQNIVGLPSNTVQTILPNPLPEGFDPYVDIYRSLMLGILLSFHMPEPVNDGSANQVGLTTGWGSMNSVSGFFRYTLANSLPSDYQRRVDTGEPGSAQAAVSDLQTNIGIRRLLETVMPKLSANSVALESLGLKWKSIKDVVDKIISYNSRSANIFGQPKIILQGGDADWYLAPYLFSATQTSNPADKAFLLTYLGLKWRTPNLIAPLPLSIVSVSERQALADFISEVLSYYSSSPSYLAWTKTSLSDLVAPSLFVYLDWLDQYVASLVKAADDLVADIEKTIQELTQYVVRLRKLAQDLQNLLNYLNIVFDAKILFITDREMNTESLISNILQAQNKPGTPAPGSLTVSPNNGLFVGAVALAFVPNAGETVMDTADTIKAAAKFGDPSQAIDATVQAFKAVFG